MRVMKLSIVALCLLGNVVSAQSKPSSEDKASSAAITGSGCVKPGVEGGCFVLRDFKSGKTFNVFFRDKFPKLDTAISFKGVESNNINFCMQGTAIDVTKWREIRMKCPKSSSEKADAKALSNSICTGWNGWYDTQPTGPRTLHVASGCSLRLGETAKLVPRVPPGINPDIYILDLVITRPKVPSKSNIVFDFPLHYVEKTDKTYGSADIEPDHVSVPIKVIQ